MSDRRSEPLPGALRRFVDRFDRAEYWLAHEELEELWMRDRRDCYKGLIHVAAALLHAERGNHGGARTKIRSAIDYLRSDPDCPGFEGSALIGLVCELDGSLGSTGGDDASLEAWARRRPPLRPLFAVAVPEGFAPPEDLPYRVRRHEQGYRTRRDPRQRD